MCRAVYHHPLDSKAVGWAPKQKKAGNINFNIKELEMRAAGEFLGLGNRYQT
jgi:hypothetical protein